MNAVHISPEEKQSGQMRPENVATAKAALQRDGYVVLTNATDPAHIETLRDRMFAEVKAFTSRPDAPYNWNANNLQQGAPPFAPYLFRDILVNDFAIAVSKSLLGDGLYCTMYSGNTALPGGERQPVHFDYNPLWPDYPEPAPPHGLIVNIPLVDIYPENGSIELWPGTHLLTVQAGGGDIKLPPEAVEERRKIAPPLQPTANAGSILLRDTRLWHAGMPNHTQTPRPLLAMIHWIRWFRDDGYVTFSKEAEEVLKHPDLRWQVRFTDDIIDHTRDGSAYEFARK